MMFAQSPVSTEVQLRAHRAAQGATWRSAATREHRGGPTSLPTRQRELLTRLAVVQCRLIPCISAVPGQQCHRRPVRQEQ